jgi:hypothetical protein
MIPYTMVQVRDIQLCGLINTGNEEARQGLDSEGTVHDAHRTDGGYRPSTLYEKGCPFPDFFMIRCVKTRRNGPSGEEES